MAAITGNPSLVPFQLVIQHTAKMTASSPEQIKQLLATTHKTKAACLPIRKEWIQYIATPESCQAGLLNELASQENTYRHLTNEIEQLRPQQVFLEQELEKATQLKEAAEQRFEEVRQLPEKTKSQRQKKATRQLAAQKEKSTRQTNHFQIEHQLQQVNKLINEKQHRLESLAHSISSLKEKTADLHSYLKTKFDASESALTEEISKAVKSIFPKATPKDRDILSDCVRGFVLFKDEDVYLQL